MAPLVEEVAGDDVAEVVEAKVHEAGLGGYLFETTGDGVALDVKEGRVGRDRAWQRLEAPDGGGATRGTRIVV